MNNNPQAFYFTTDGIKFHVRPILPSDKALLQTGFGKLSARSRYFRFFALQRQLSEMQLKYFTEVDGINHVAWGILDESGEEPIPVAVGRFIKLKEEPGTAEVAFTVVDDYQRKGIGGILLSVMNIVAAHAGIEKFRYYVLAENQFVLDNLKQLGILKREYEGPMAIVDVKVFPDHSAVPNVPELQNFITAMKKAEELIGA